MSWGDPYDKFYKDDGDVRREGLIDRGYVPGVMITFGNYTQGTAPKPVHVWTFPDLKSNGFDVAPGVGCIIGVDCESDPATDWLMVLINASSGTAFGWLPVSLVRKAEAPDDD